MSLEAAAFTLLINRMTALPTDPLMTTKFNPIPCWSTASNNQGLDNFPIEALGLREHLNHCKKSHSHFYGVVYIADAMHGFSAARFVTTLIAVVALFVISSLVM